WIPLAFSLVPCGAPSVQPRARTRRAPTAVILRKSEKALFGFRACMAFTRLGSKRLRRVPRRTTAEWWPHSEPPFERRRLQRVPLLRGTAVAVMESNSGSPSRIAVDDVQAHVCRGMQFRTAPVPLLGRGIVASKHVECCPVVLIVARNVEAKPAEITA